MEEETYASSSMTQNQKKSNIVQSTQVKNRPSLLKNTNDRLDEKIDIIEDYCFNNVTHPTGVIRTIFWTLGDTTAYWNATNRTTAGITNGFFNI
jgi:hypothetical protein